MKLNYIITFLLLIGIVLAVIGFAIFNKAQEEKPTSTPPEQVTIQPEWKTYSLTSATFSYPADKLPFVRGQEESSVFLTNSEQVDSPLGMTDEGLWVEATIYPASAKSGLIEQVEKLIADPNETVATHPITPYPDKFKKEKNTQNGGVLLVSSATSSGEMATVLWTKNDKVYQLRVVSDKSVYDSFKQTFEQIAESFTITY